METEKWIGIALVLLLHGAAFVYAWATMRSDINALKEHVADKSLHQNPEVTNLQIRHLEQAITDLKQMITALSKRIDQLLATEEKQGK